MLNTIAWKFEIGAIEQIRNEWIGIKWEKEWNLWLERDVRYRNTVVSYGGGDRTVADRKPPSRSQWIRRRP